MGMAYIHILDIISIPKVRGQGEQQKKKRKGYKKEDRKKDTNKAYCSIYFKYPLCIDCGHILR